MKRNVEKSSFFEQDATKNLLFYLTNDSRYIISDIDNTICFTYRKWANECCKKMEWFKDKVEKAIGAKYITDDERSMKAIDERPTASITEWLGLTKSERLEYHKIYDEDEHFYDDIEITDIGNALKLLGSRRLMIMSHFDKDSKNIASKLNLINRLYGEETPCFLVPLNEPKSNYVNKKQCLFSDGTPASEVGLFFDDNVSVCMDVHKHCKGPIQFIIPEYGYNADFKTDRVAQ